MTSTGNETGNVRAAQTPQFLNKLSAMVDDPATDRFIKWADDGSSFYVFSPDQFAKELLGTYYKTDASASFVRQLNMYGFHKVPHVRQGALKSDKQAQAWHYRNPNFRRGRPDLLPYITRKGKAVGGAAGVNANNLALQPIKQPDLDNDLELLSGPLENSNSSNTSDALARASSTSSEVAKGSPKNIDMSQIINGLATIKRHQTLISDNLKDLQSSNQALWQEAMEARERHRKHQETINRILKFLASLFQGSVAAPVRSTSMSSGKSSNDVGVPAHRRTRLMIKDVPEKDDDNEDNASTPRSSVRMEEIEFLDDDIPSAKVATVETPQTPATEQSPTTPNPQTNSSQYPFPDQGHFLSNGTYIPPADAWKMLQWLQQNHIPIPGVSYPTTDVNAGALTTMPANGVPFNQLAFANALAEMSGANANFTGNPMQPGQGGNGNAASWPTTYGPQAIPNQQQQQPNGMGSLYQNNSNQFLNTLLPLASMANDRPSDVNMAQVSQNGDKLDQLSNHVQAMEQGIDSLIQGMGLDPLSAASLRTQQGISGNNAAPTSSFSLEPSQQGQQQQQQQLSNSMSMSNGLNGLSQDGLSTNMDPYQSNPPDFDLDELLKHLGAAAAANTPPALHASDGFPDMNMNDQASGFNPQLNQPFDPNMFNDVNMNMYGQNSDPSQFYSMGDTGQSQQTQQQPSSSSGFLNEVNSPVTTRADSVEPIRVDTDAGSKGSTVGRGRSKKRKQGAVDGSPIGEGNETAVPTRATSKGTGRASKRRK